MSLCARPHRRSATARPTCIFLCYPRAIPHAETRGTVMTTDHDDALAADLLPMSRRSVLKATAAMAIAHVAGITMTLEAAAVNAAATPTPDEKPPAMMRVRLKVNAGSFPLIVDTPTALLDALRVNLRLQGTKKRLRTRHVWRGCCDCQRGVRRVRRSNPRVSVDGQ